MEKRTYAIVSIMLLIGTLMGSMQAAAHNPGFMKLDYEQDTLQVLIVHFTFARTFHYVYKIDIEKNGNLDFSELYQNQPKFLLFRYTYDVNVTSGDELTVIAYCSLFGKITRSITV